ncbi:MAG TPA: hypothetical protein VL307_12115 [Chitinophagaceae bacterium]|nr:hypothetical protein [Chitinophagaceae bacterium]
MKQKFLYLVLLVLGMYLPASSEECSSMIKKAMPACCLRVVEKPVAAADDLPTLPLSLFSKLMIKL